MTNSWARTEVAHARTHHLAPGGAPLYPARIIEVLSFHEPGLAAVRDDTGAFHILPSGEPAYARRFSRTFGFYDGRAAVDDRSRAFHILADGTDLGTERYAWCGNFQGARCTVRTERSEYFTSTWLVARLIRSGMRTPETSERGLPWYRNCPGITCTSCTTAFH